MKWINIEEKIPDPEVHVLISDGENVAMGSYQSYNGNIYWHPSATGHDYEFLAPFNEYKITHWMPIPKAPNKQ